MEVSIRQTHFIVYMVALFQDYLKGQKAMINESDSAGLGLTKKQREVITLDEELDFRQETIHCSSV